ncbi:hypothetical protein B0H14DRAFT_2564195 [Mycena olivaceomarginata]|nr:hypothetical protein B0H14DRAFT_2564195 [Mycena olivaceomarginata]
MSSPLHVSGEESGSRVNSRDSSPSSSGTPSPSNHDPVEDLFGGIPFHSVYGPVLPSDDPNQIYDDFSGDLARNRPSPGPYDSDDDEDEESDFGEPPSDGIRAVESDGLLHQYNEEFAEEQRETRSLPLGTMTGGAGPVNLQECLLDLMSGFPRACFSEKELNATQWYAKKNGVSLQPTIKQVKNHRQSILNVAGLERKLIDGKLGNSFAVNDWFKILEHEFANPLIRPKLHLYPEDSGDRLEEGRQAANGRRKWTAIFQDRWLGVMAERIITLRSISGVLHDPALPLDPWEQPTVNNRVHSVPLWTYCDDTSGNVSKKWNKHNSILFTLAGLPRALTQMLYNIHFIATSNLSPPLEMIEAVTAMLREARDDGIQVWDCEYNEWILILPWFLAFQGDNPMSSEFASHVGMKGKFFVVFAGTPRSKDQTIADLTAQLKRAIDGAPSAVDDMATESGLQGQILPTFSGQTPGGSIETPRRTERNAGPTLMQHSDTPVEILHVVLLGVVKYWWRDAVSRQTSKGKEELKARLSSVDVAGFKHPNCLRAHLCAIRWIPGRSRLPSHPSGCLGRLHGLIPDAYYKGWIALCNLAPLMFQPVIEHLPTYLERLKNAVLDFLTATALWNTQWFNKPKFHLFVHLIEHIRRFGPLILYATESFESINLVIRLRSIHSTKHAPSVDIATAFSHLHAIRHLVSGGYVLVDEDGNEMPLAKQALRSLPF